MTFKAVFTSDLHYTPSQIHNMFMFAEEIRAEHPDFVGLAGDIGHPAENFTDCLSILRQVMPDIPMALVPGNHDLWKSERHSSYRLHRDVLPEICKDFNIHWLASDLLCLDSVILVGTMGWYDYSAALPRDFFSPRYFEDLKKSHNNDSEMINWGTSDLEISEGCKFSLMQSLEAAQTYNDNIIIMTHMPIFESQLERRPEDFVREQTNAFFGNLTLGEAVIETGIPIKAVVSGHTHLGKMGKEGNIDTYVIGSDYGDPAYITIQL